MNGKPSDIARSELFTARGLVEITIGGLIMMVAVMMINCGA